MRRRPEMVRYRLLVIGLIVGRLVWGALTLVVGALLLSMVGLLISQHYGHAVLVGLMALVVGYWLLVGRWLR
jgi:hypothetical protein